MIVTTTGRVIAIAMVSTPGRVIATTMMSASGRIVAIPMMSTTGRVAGSMMTATGRIMPTGIEHESGRTPREESRSPEMIVPSGAWISIGIVITDRCIAVPSIASQFKREDRRMVQSVFLIRIAERDENLFLQWYISIFSDHQSDRASGNPFPDLHPFIFNDGIHFAWGTAEVEIDIIERDIRSSGGGYDLESAIHIQRAQEAYSQQEAE